MAGPQPAWRLLGTPGRSGRRRCRASRRLVEGASWPAMRCKFDCGNRRTVVCEGAPGRSWGASYTKESASSGTGIWPPEFATFSAISQAVNDSKGAAIALVVSRGLRTSSPFLSVSTFYGPGHCPRSTASSSPPKPASTYRLKNNIQVSGTERYEQVQKWQTSDAATKTRQRVEIS